jgi:hypothetical protein
VVTNAALCPQHRSEASWDSVAVEIFDFNVNMLALTIESISPVKKCKDCEIGIASSSNIFTAENYQSSSDTEAQSKLRTSEEPAVVETMALKPEPLENATVASPLQQNVSVMLTLLMEAHSNLDLSFPSFLMT